MTISFNHMPAQIGVPGQHVEFDNSRALRGLGQITCRILMFGQKTAAGTAVADVPVLVQREDQANILFGDKSILADMLRTFFKVNPALEAWVIPQADNGAGVAATGTFTLTGTATEDGTFSALVAGRRYQVGVSSGDTAAAVAADLAAEITADTTATVTAAAVGGVVTVTAVNKGELGNDIDLRVNYYAQNESTPVGLAVAIAQMTGGATNPVITASLASLVGQQYTDIVFPYSDDANLDMLEADMAQRWLPVPVSADLGPGQNDSHVWTAKRGSETTLATYALNRNSPHVTMIAVEGGRTINAIYYGGVPSPIWQVAAVYGATGSYYACNNPATPLQNLELTCLLPAPVQCRFAWWERNRLIINHGFATYSYTSDDRFLLERATTMYTKNANSFNDKSYMDTETLKTLSFLRLDFRRWVSQTFPRHRLSGDETNYGRGRNIVTPGSFRRDLIGYAGVWHDAGLIEDLAQFGRDLIVEIDGSDCNRLNVNLFPNLVNQFRVTAAKMSFILC